MSVEINVHSVCLIWACKRIYNFFPPFLVGRAVKLFSISNFVNLLYFRFYFRRKQRFSIFILHIFRFNKSPSKGLKFLQTEGLLGDSVTEVAQFLHTDDKLDKVISLSYPSLFD